MIEKPHAIVHHRKMFDGKIYNLIGWSKYREGADGISDKYLKLDFLTKVVEDPRKEDENKWLVYVYKPE